MNILIVDDSETSRMIIWRCLEICGWGDHSRFDASDGLQALQILLSTPIDCVITDLNMPRMDGLTLVKKITLTPKLQKPPIIVFSSLASAPLEEELKALGVRSVIHKPITPEKLCPVLEGLHVG